MTPEQVMLELATNPNVSLPIVGTRARKDDTDKPRMGLISSKFLNALAQALTYGAKNHYNAHQWRKGLEHSRVYDAVQRHLTKYNDGEDIDGDSGLPNLWCAAAELMFLVELSQTHPELDDRYKP